MSGKKRESGDLVVQLPRPLGMEDDVTAPFLCTSAVSDIEGLRERGELPSSSVNTILTHVTRGCRERPEKRSVVLSTFNPSRYFLRGGGGKMPR